VRRGHLVEPDRVHLVRRQIKPGLQPNEFGIAVGATVVLPDTGSGRGRLPGDVLDQRGERVGERPRHDSAGAVDEPAPRARPEPGKPVRRRHQGSGRVDVPPKDRHDGVDRPPR
jgi:hypothetical protein